MERATSLRLIERLRGELESGDVRVCDIEGREPFVVAAERYRDPERCASERAKLFGAPRIVAVAASLEPGGCLPIDGPGRAALIVRGRDGVVRAFANACRHRGTRLVDKACNAKALSCPYHAWTYDLTGKLVHVPHAETFAGVDLETRDLTPLAVTERYGLVWLGDGVDEHLGELGHDVAALGLERYVMWQRSRTTRRCNWKLVIEAFLDSYHIRVLHRDSVYRFFLDAASAAERSGPHIRAVTGRRALRAAKECLAEEDLGQLATASLYVFPATVVVEHPGFVSIMTVHPLSANETAWDHMMLVPAHRVTETDHWAKSWKLIEEGVFQREDLWVCEQAQHSIDAGAVDELLFGTLESPVRWFHAAVDAALDA